MEKDYEKKITKLCLKYGECYKLNATGHGRVGLPDRVCCINGKFVAIEIKNDSNYKVDYMQLKQLEKIWEEGGIGILIVADKKGEYLKRLEQVLIEIHKDIPINNSEILTNEKTLLEDLIRRKEIIMEI